MGKAQRDKGARGERIIRDMFIAAGFEARRGLQAQGGGVAPDVVLPGLPVHIEVKTGKAPPIWQAVEQAARDAGPGNVAVAVCRRDRCSPVVAMPWDDFLELLKAAEREWRR